MTTHLPKILTVALLALLAAIIGFWVSRLTAPTVAIAPVSVTAENTATSDATWARQFFGQAKESATNMPVVDSQFQVVGLISGRSGVAIISADGKPGKAFAVGQTIVPGSILKAVYSEKVVISRQGREIELPLPLKQNMAILTSGGSRSGDSAPTAILTGGISTSPAPTLNPSQNFAPPPTSMQPMPQNGTPVQNANPPVSGSSVVNSQQGKGNSGSDVPIPVGGSARGTPPS